MIYGIGTDLVELKRFQSIDLQRFALRICTKEEIERLPHHPTRFLESLAGRFAAKEAFSKACGTGIGAKLGWLDIEILPNQDGKPVLQIAKQAKMRLFPGKEVHAHVSITHTESYAMAMVVLEEIHNHS
ncbi:holo-[acyl-carrier-protein] synthase [Seinonella peptonophila]|uniref:Holo-[acyl-carrier-protein] synthase n=1 Tax=Seinonella peptonophila TaxID=112248 RepID=A0A1M4YD60_9BACL|nr:holo-ACP synthase [Seinonella peptonophila]SHF03513.1 holo-[acyl-carrier-protein] synthase [Seinonella peptonophila]